MKKYKNIIFQDIGLSDFENDILEIVLRHYPVSWKQVRDAYEITRSIDGTITAIENHVMYAEDLNKIASFQKNYTLRNIENK